MPANEILIYNAALQGYNAKQTIQEEVDFTVSGDQKLTKVIFKSGNIQVQSTSSFPFNSQVIIEFPDVINPSDNSKLSISFPIPANTANQVNTIQLGGYELDLTKGGTTQNRLRYNVSYSVVKPSGQTALILPGNSVAFDVNIANMKYSYLEGYLGEIALPTISSQVQVELFKNSIEGDVEFDEPIIRVGFDNSAGIKSHIRIDPLQVDFAHNGTTEVISRNGSVSFLDTVIRGSAITDPYTIATTNITWNSQNSNIKTAFKPSPFTVNYNANLVLNKKTEISEDLLNFITDKSIVRVRAEVELPLIGKLNSLSIVDTVKIELNTGFQESYSIDSITYKLNTENGFPIDCKLQTYFLDENRVKRDSLITDPNLVIMPAATVGADGRVISKSYKYYQRTFSKATYDANIKDAKYLLVVGKFNSFKNAAGVPQTIKIFSDNSIRVKLSGEVRAIIKASTKD